MQRQQIIEKVIARQSSATTEELITLWEKLASQIVSLMSETGFDSLYDRSVYLTQPSFPWLASSASPAYQASRLAALNICLNQQSPDDIGRANGLLLHNFTDILASLIGEALTSSILRSAWGDEVSDQVSKEQKQ